MEYLVAALVLLLTVGYAVFVAISVEKGKGWAKETARAISMLDPHSANFEVRSRAMEPVSEIVEQPSQQELPAQPDRLAA
jgi:hypothetical protein